jgi:YidC/Oxa1 family membrane protein insertase
MAYNLTASLGMANYGVAIIILTVVIKLALYPLTVKQVKSMKAMQDLSPKMKQLQEKYKNDKERLNKEMAELYKTMGVNPLSGCLPLVIQMPVLMGIFFAIRDYQYLQDPPSWFYIANLSQPDPYYVLPVLSALSTWWMQRQTTPTTTPTTQQNKMMMVFMPLFIGYISFNFPAGLVLYWVVSNFIQIGQQWWMFRTPAQE